MKRLRSNTKFTDAPCEGCVKPEENVHHPDLDDDENRNQELHAFRPDRSICCNYITQSSPQQELRFHTPLRNVSAAKIELMSTSLVNTSVEETLIGLYCGELNTFQRNNNCGFNTNDNAIIHKTPIVWVQPSGFVSNGTVIVPWNQFVSQLPSEWMYFDVVRDISTLNFRIDSVPTGGLLVFGGESETPFRVIWRLTTRHENI